MIRWVKEQKQKQNAQDGVKEGNEKGEEEKKQQQQSKKEEGEEEEL